MLHDVSIHIISSEIIHNMLNEGVNSSVTICMLVDTALISWEIAMKVVVVAKTSLKIREGNCLCIAIYVMYMRYVIDVRSQVKEYNMKHWEWIPYYLRLHQ